MEKIQEDNSKNYNFTPREKDILPLLAAGLKNEDIANILHISVSTVKVNLTNIFEKLCVENRTQAVAKILEEHLIPRRDLKQP